MFISVGLLTFILDLKVRKEGKKETERNENESKKRLGAFIPDFKIRKKGQKGTNRKEKESKKIYLCLSLFLYFL